MKLVCSERDVCVSKAGWAHKLDWSAVKGSNGFTVHTDNGDCLADVNFDDHTARAYCVEFAGKDTPGRIITAAEVIPTVQLFLNVSKRRKTLNSGVVMVVFPKYS
jgi:hypothetical protein